MKVWLLHAPVRRAGTKECGDRCAHGLSGARALPMRHAGRRRGMRRPAGGVKSGWKTVPGPRRPRRRGSTGMRRGGGGLCPARGARRQAVQAVGLAADMAGMTVGARRSALGARRSALGARRSALGARRSALGARRSALGARRSALGANYSYGPVAHSRYVIQQFRTCQESSLSTESSLSSRLTDVVKYDNIPHEPRYAAGRMERDGREDLRNLPRSRPGAPRHGPDDLPRQAARADIASR